MDLRTRILEADQPTGNQQPIDPNALATIGKAIAGLAMKAQFNDLNTFLKEFKDTEVFQALLKANPEVSGEGEGASFEELFKSDNFKNAMQQVDKDGTKLGNKDFTLAQVLKACFATQKGSQAYNNVHTAFKKVFGFDYGN